MPKSSVVINKSNFCCPFDENFKAVYEDLGWI